MTSNNDYYGTDTAADSDPDYYQVLGISPSSDFREIQNAWRQKCLVHHPDRGGSKEEMQRINLAYEVLKDPDKRKHYDTLRADPHNPETVKTANEDAREAAQNVSKYPQSWSEYEKMFHNLAEDFASARYGQTKNHIFFPIPLPTVENSATGVLFLVLGFVLSGWFLAIPAYQSLSHSVPGSAHPIRLFPWIVGVAIATLGAWGGIWVHKAVTELLRNAPVKSDSASTVQEPEKLVISCNKCHQKQRVPRTPQEIIVTCVKCHNKFTWPPSSS